MPAFVYILSNKRRTTLYIGVTINIQNRMNQHRAGCVKKSFTARYNLSDLIYLEQYETIEVARAREHQLKKWSRTSKEKLIASVNPCWKDLSETLLL